MDRYRIKAYDPVNDIWILQKQIFWFIWRSMSAGSKKKLEMFIKEQERANKMDDRLKIKPTPIEVAELVSQCSLIPDLAWTARRVAFQLEYLQDRVKELEKLSSIQLGAEKRWADKFKKLEDENWRLKKSLNDWQDNCDSY